MGLMEKFTRFTEKREKKREFFNQVLDEERKKARLAANAAEEVRLRKKAKEKARFEAQPLREKARERLQKGSSLLQKLGGGVSTVKTKLERAEKRFNQKAKEFDGQNTTIQPEKNVKPQLGGSLGESILK